MNELVEKQVYCPYCGEFIDLLIDTSVSHQNYIEDCQVCCRPIIVDVIASQDGDVSVTASHEDE